MLTPSERHFDRLRKCIEAALKGLKCVYVVSNVQLAVSRLKVGKRLEAVD